MSRALRIIALLSLFFLHIQPSWAQSESFWGAASGLTPEQIWPPYALMLAGGASEPVLDSGVLTIDTSANTQNAFFMQFYPVVITDRPFIVEFELRLVSGSSSSSSRGPVMIFITLAGSAGTLLVIDEDAVFFAVGPTTAGKIASVDTNDAPHVYRLEHDGMGGFTLFYDDAQILTASAFSNASSHGTQMRIGWGEGSSIAHGVSQWYWFRHTAADPFFRGSFEADQE